MADVEKYIGIEFKERESNFGECDCYGLVKLFYEKELQIKLKMHSCDYVDKSDKHGINKIHNQGIIEWKKVDKPKKHDVALFRCFGIPMHVGIIVDEKNMLHIIEGANSCLEPFGGTKWKNKLLGFYRYARAN